MRQIILLTAALVAFAATSMAMMIDGEQMSMDDAIIKAGSNDSMSKMFEIMQDDKVVMLELDMLFKMDTYMAMREEMDEMEKEDKAGGSSRTKRKATTNTRARWTGARVPYQISPQFSANDRRIVMAAISDYHRYTCLRFVPARSERNRVVFQNGGGCSSYVGMIGGSQPISLARGCRVKGIVIHEMGHAIGFQHEQTRSDRDGFVSIQRQNIQRGVEYNFMRYPSSQANSYGVPYDYTSVMHYSQRAFSVNGRPTIIARDRRFQNAMGNRAGFSFNDIQLANTIYNCASRCTTQRSCPQGFQGPDCRCWCRSNDINNPVRVCDGTVVTQGPEVTTAAPTTAPMRCENRNQYCSRWAEAGYCTGRYERYMMTNCQRSCGTCSMTTTTTTAMPTPPVAGCTDSSRYCSYWASRGECSRNPSYMNRNCKRSCDACSGSQGTECRDMNSKCEQWKNYCDMSATKDYMSRNCMATCGVCTASDVTAVTPIPTGAPVVSADCTDMRGEEACSRVANKCGKSLRVDRMCQKTCGKC